MTLNCGTVRNRSEVVSAPVVRKSCGLRFVTGTPTAAVPRMSEPVIRTCSGTSIGDACAVCACATCWACASSEVANVRNEAVPNNALSLDVVGLMEIPPLDGERRSGFINGGGDLAL